MAGDVVEETKNQRFHRISEGRVQRAVEKIALLENLSSSNYESSVEERKAVIGEVQAAVNQVAAVFEIPTAPATPAMAMDVEAEVHDADAEDQEDDTGEGVPTAPPVAMPAPKKGEYIKFTDEDDLALLKNGGLIDRAISLIDEGNPEQARELLQQIMVS